jgi:hypothetical protein
MADSMDSRPDLERFRKSRTTTGNVYTGNVHSVKLTVSTYIQTILHTDSIQQQSCPTAIQAHILLCSWRDFHFDSNANNDHQIRAIFFIKLSQILNLVRYRQKCTCATEREGCSQSFGKSPWTIGLSRHDWRPLQSIYRLMQDRCLPSGTCIRDPKHER